MSELAASLWGGVISSMFDPEPIRFNRAHKAGAGPIRALLSRGAFDLQKLPRKLTRNAFLYGCHAFTSTLPEEHLIVGFGAKRSSTTDVGLVAHVIGDRDSVHIPFNIRSAIDGHILLEKNAEVLVFHNHPEWIANCVLDNTPWASQTDRRTMVTMAYRNLPSLARKILGKGGIRFYLGENGMVRQIRAPDVEDVLQFLGPKE